MKRYLPYAFIGMLAIIAMIGYARAESGTMMLCKSQEAIEDYVQKKYVTKEPFALPGCIFAEAVFMPVEKVKTITNQGAQYEIWRIAVVAHVVDDKATGFMEAQERYALRVLRVPEQNI